jgi:bifunctional non-homologous end joining protein LigD
VRTATVASPGSTRNRETIDYVVADELATLIWVANLASLELHTPMWRVSTGRPDLMVVDLDPGPPATIVECCRVACHVRDATGLDWYAKTSGSKGLQLYTAVRDERTSEQTSAEMKALAERLEREQPELVVSRMTKAIRPGKVLLDWSQNSSAKTTVSVYSLRARPEHTVSTPVTWDEVAGCRAPEDLVFRTDDVLARVEEYGDLFAPLL